jgi:hypothetical protein
MKRLVPVLAVLTAVFVGCSKSSSVGEAPEDGVTESPVVYTPPVQSSDGFSTQQTTPARATIAPPEPAVAATPDAVVSDFLTALRDGDDATAEALLTNKALQETSKRHLRVQPPGTPSARFQIGQVSYVTSDKRGAHVSSVWSEQDVPGGELTYEIVWALRKQQDGWKIAGMATQVTEDGPAVFLNFEDPDDMLAKWREAERALAAQHQDTGVRQASRTESDTANGDFQR